MRSEVLPLFPKCSDLEGKRDPAKGGKFGSPAYFAENNRLVVEILAQEVPCAILASLEVSLE